MWGVFLKAPWLSVDYLERSAAGLLVYEKRNQALAARHNGMNVVRPVLVSYSIPSPRKARRKRT